MMLQHNFGDFITAVVCRGEKSRELGSYFEMLGPPKLVSVVHYRGLGDDQGRFRG